MIDQRLLLDDFEQTVVSLATKKVDRKTLEDARDAVLAQRDLLHHVEELRRESNRAAQEIGALVRRGEERPPTLVGESRALKDQAAAAEQDLRDIEARARDLLLRIPNLPSPLAPVGSGEEDNVVMEVCNYDASRYESQEFKPHWEIGEELGIYDPARAAKISGSMFALLRGDGARLLRALVSFGLELNRATYEEIAPPHMVRSETFTATGHLPKFEEDAYRLRDDDLWMIPTGEVPLMSLHRDELLDEVDLPKRYMAYTVCFRREAGSHGKDTRGMQRLHEFHKVELLKLCTPDQAEAEFAALLADARRTLDLLELPYRLLDLCTADLTFSSNRIIDLEAYAPGTQRWLEVSSVGDFGNFQTRRGSIRFRPTGGGRPVFAHALNASAMATPRIWAALLEHGYEAETQTVRLPAALVPYFGAERFPVT